MQVILDNIKTNLNPFQIYCLYKDEKEIIFLDSARDFNGLGRYSFIGLNKFITIKQEHNQVFVNGELVQGDIFFNINKILQKYNVENNTDLPFVSGGMGYFSYDKDKNLPDVYYNFYDNLIIVDNLKNKVYLSALGILKDAKESIDDIKKKIEGAKPFEYKLKSKDINYNKFKSNFTQKKYIEAVDKVKKYIVEGDIYVANLSQRFSCDFKGDEFETYAELRAINPEPFAAYMNLQGVSVLCSSPERFLKLQKNILETRPIKGTRPRGENKEIDNILRQELVDSEKDKSELLMVVDLERNDLSKICKPSTVKVTELFKVESYPAVHHLIATIQGEIKENVNMTDALKACFPGGSITGAPKIRSMEIIEEIEGINRGIYTGCLGYLSFHHSMDLNIVIRTIIIKENKAYFGVGGGITFESDSAYEYEETLHKAGALMRVLSIGDSVC